jgi:hypothetical protein
MVDAFNGVEIAYSLGICDDVSWDFDIAQLGIDVYQYDHTIDKLPFEHGRFHWEKIDISHTSEGNLKSLGDLITENRHSSATNMLLKCDIEGSEWLSFEIRASHPKDLNGRRLLPDRGAYGAQRLAVAAPLSPRRRSEAPGRALL